MMRWSSAVLVAAIGILSTQAQAQTASPECPVAGRYAVAGNNPGNAGSYTGQASISGNGVGCYMKWDPPNNSEGSGTYENGVLTVHFSLKGNTGVVQYTRQSDGSMTGVWWNDPTPNSRGTETLFLISLAKP